MQPESDKTSDAPPSTKARILQAAQEVFAQRGFDGASTREIASRAGVNISSLHYHWDSKETLYLAIIERIQQQLVGLIKDEIKQPATPTEFRAVIERAMGITFDYLTSDLTIPKLLIRRIIESEGAVAERERDEMGHTWKRFGEWVREFAGGRLSVQEVSFVMLTIQSVLLVLMLDSPHVTALLGGSVQDPAVRDRLRGQVIDLVVTLMGVD